MAGPARADGGLDLGDTFSWVLKVLHDLELGAIDLKKGPAMSWLKAALSSRGRFGSCVEQALATLTAGRRQSYHHGVL